ncbi:multidrug ABC transporter ATPase [Methylobacterium aquaticum]|jgi:ABC-type multidrug transport system fused ATPase/permease subunit|uniref:multidrug ABC transporter ATPase n=1 Tax=Methylobacterium aquaticum TaxID=270351 RepID=UPI001FEEB922|nr:multidrug ABC transporter ATPase [Methylobacterium aquaticum]
MGELGESDASRRAPAFEHSVTAPALIHDLMGRVPDRRHFHNDRWLSSLAALACFVAPAWTPWLASRSSLRWAERRRRSQAQVAASLCGAPAALASRTARTVPAGVNGWRLEGFIVGATLHFQLRLVLLSLLTLPSAWLLLEIPKHIINHTLAGANGGGHPQMTFLGLDLGRVELLFALCASYLGALTMGALAKYAVNQGRGRVSERIVRRLRLAIFRRARGERSLEHRATLAAIAVQEVEPIGYFGAGMVVVPLVQGGTLATSIAFLLLQNTTLALAALVMLPVQLSLLPRLQKRLNAKVRERVHATRVLGGLLTATDADQAVTPAVPVQAATRRLSSLLRQMRQAEDLERVRVEISELKGRLKSLYSFTSNLTPFFFFSIGGYLVVQGRISLGALVAALAAYKEIAPALRELFDFIQSWSDANARFEEVTKAFERP